MQALQTIVDLPKYPFAINHKEKIFTIGSCFANMIASKMHESKFAIFGNPMGIVYNPISLSQQLERSISKEEFREEDIFSYRDLWHSFAHHSRFSDVEQEEALTRMNKYLSMSHEHLKTCSTLIITLGTAYAYHHHDTNQIVANCHKLPADDFDKQRLTTKQIIQAMEGMLDKLFVFNPNVQVLVSVSPVRHFRDGYIKNQRSKAALLLAAEALESSFEQVHYFPAYEIMLDELRDYRFFARDMVHPSDVAKDYIWERFRSVFFEEETLNVLKQIAKVVRASNHRPFQINTPAHQRFIGQQLLQIQTLLQQYPYLNLNTEIAKFQKQVAPTIDL